MLRNSSWFLLAAALCLPSPPALAAIFTLAEGNAVLNVSDTDPRGAYNWTIDGTDILYQQWFWFRVGTAAEQSLDTLPVVSATVSPVGACAACVLDLLYQGSTFTIDVRYSLMGGMPGSGAADIGEQISITNQRNTALEFHFYQYSDFNLSPRDTVEIDPTRHSVTQRPAAGGSELVEAVAVQAASRAEAALYPNTVNRLNDSAPTLLSNVLNAGPGNVTWAFEWDTVIPRRGTYVISKDKLITPIPEPATLLLAGLTMTLLRGKLRLC